MVKCKYCEKDANNCFRHLGIWMCQEHADKYHELYFEKMLKKMHKENDEMIDDFEKTL